MIDPPNTLASCRHGLMLYNRLDAYVGKSLHNYGEFSEGEVELFQRLLKPGSVVFEAGANIGALTIPIAQIVGNEGAVFSFEPVRQNFVLLCANIALNNLENVRANQLAVGAEVGFVNVPHVSITAPQNFGGVTLLADYREVPHEILRLVTIDSYRPLKCDLIKADVEGMETDVLIGAMQTIKTHRPILYVENDREEQAARLLKALDLLGYRIYRHNVPLFNPNNYRGLSEDLFECASLNLLCFPKEKEAPIELTAFEEICTPQRCEAPPESHQ